MIHSNPNTLQERQSARHGILGRRIFVILGILALCSLIFVWSADATRQSAMEERIWSLVTDLDSERLTVARHRAQRELEEAGKAAIRPLLVALHSPSLILRANAAEMLGYIGSPHAAEGLIHALDDTNANVRSRAASALGALNDTRAVNPLERAAASDPSVRVRDAATNALASLQGYWARTAGKQAEYVGALAVAPGYSDLVYLAELNELSASRDGGVTWIALSSTLPSHVSAMAVDPSQQNVIYAGADSLGLYKSIDGGDSWHAVNDGLGMAAGVRLRITALAIDPENPNRIFAARGVWIGTSHVELIPLGLMESRDSGITWYAVDVPALDQAIGRLVVTNGKLYAAAGERVISVELAAEDEL